MITDCLLFNYIFNQINPTASGRYVATGFRKICKIVSQVWMYLASTDDNRFSAIFNKIHSNNWLLSGSIKNMHQRYSLKKICCYFLLKSDIIIKNTDWNHLYYKFLIVKNEQSCKCRLFDWSEIWRCEQFISDNHSCICEYNLMLIILKKKLNILKKIIGTETDYTK